MKSRHLIIIGLAVSSSILMYADSAFAQGGAII